MFADNPANNEVAANQAANPSNPMGECHGDVTVWGRCAYFDLMDAVR